MGADIIRQEPEKIQEHVIGLMEILKLPEWVKDAYKNGVLCGTYTDALPPVSGVIKEGSKEWNDIQAVVKQLDESPISGLEHARPYYVFMKKKEGKTSYFLFTTETWTDEYYYSWTLEEKEIKKGKARIYFAEEDKLLSDLPLPMKVTTLPIFAGMEDRSCLMLQPYTEEEYAEMNIVFR